MMNFLCKETLFWIPFAMDLLLCLIQFPMFALNGPEWMAQTMRGMEPKKDDSKSAVSSDYVQLYDLFLLCYSGYCALMFYGCYTILTYPDDLLPVFGALMLAVILAKVVLILRWEQRDNPTNVKLQQSKHASLLYFNLPTYGGYCLLYLWEQWNQ